MGMIDSVREAIGDQAAAMLVKSFGGRKVYVPLAASDTWIGRAIGAKAAAALSRRFGGEYIEVPNLQRRGGRNRSVLLSARFERWPPRILPMRRSRGSLAARASGSARSCAVTPENRLQRAFEGRSGSLLSAAKKAGIY